MIVGPMVHGDNYIAFLIAYWTRVQREEQYIVSLEAKGSKYLKQ